MESLKERLKAETLKDENIVKLLGCYRYINNKRGFLTTGFRTKKGLVENKDKIRFDANTIPNLALRYKEIYLGECEDSIILSRTFVDLKIEELEELIDVKMKEVDKDSLSEIFETVQELGNLEGQLDFAKTLTNCEVE